VQPVIQDHPEESKREMHVALQASIFAKHDSWLEGIKAMMVSMMTSFEKYNNGMASTIVKQNNSHIPMME
jgi:hypothetical protein